jgi:anti-anti-sigma regulatory factor
VYSVELDPSRRLLVISAAGHVSAAEARAVVEELRTLLQPVAPGFHVLADFRWLDSMDTAAAQHVAAIMDLLVQRKVASVARVMPDPHKDIGFNILSKFHYGPEIRVETFERLADAISALMEQ